MTTNPYMSHNQQPVAQPRPVGDPPRKLSPSCQGAKGAEPITSTLERLRRSLRQPFLAGKVRDTLKWTYCGWLRNPASPKGWLKPYKQ